MFVLERRHKREKEKVANVWQLLRSFEWEVVDPTKPWECRNVGIWIQKDLNVRVTERAMAG